MFNKLAKYILTFIVMVSVPYIYNNNKAYISEIYYGKNYKDYENWEIAVARDFKLIFLNNSNEQYSKNIEIMYNLTDRKNIQEFINSLIKGKNKISNKIEEGHSKFFTYSLKNHIQHYIDLLTYMSTGNYSNKFAKNIAYDLFFYDLLKNVFRVLLVNSKELDSDKFKNSTKLIVLDDIKLIKKGTVYTLTLGEKVINMVVDLEKLLNEAEKQNIDTRPERNFLKTILCNKT